MVQGDDRLNQPAQSKQVATDETSRLLQEDERIVWAGTGSAARHSLGELVARWILVVVLIFLVGGCLFSAISSLWASPSRRSDKLVTVIVLSPVLILPALGLYATGHRVRRLRKTTYTITNRRALVLVSGFCQDACQVHSYELSELQIETIQVKELADGSGDIFLSSAWETGHGDEAPELVQRGFKSIPNVCATHQLLLEAISSCRRTFPATTAKMHPVGERNEELCIDLSLAEFGESGEQIRRQLHTGERVLWAARPIANLIKVSWSEVCFLGLVLSVGSMLLLWAVLIKINHLSGYGLGVVVIFVIVGGIFCLAAALGVVRFVVNRSRIKKTLQVITDRRVIVQTHLCRKTQTTTFSPSQLGALSIEQDDTGGGQIVFFTRPARDNQLEEFGLFGLKNVSEVVGLLGKLTTAGGKSKS